MGWFSDTWAVQIEQHLVEVDVRANLLGSAEYNLIIDHTKVDSIKGSIGEFYLRGHLPNQEKDPVKIRIKQGLFRTKAFLVFREKDVPLKR